MKSFVEHLSQYAEYHRDQRNINTHLFGVPTIVFAVIVLLSRPQFEFVGHTINPAMIIMPIVLLFYLRLNILFALLMGILMTVSIMIAQHISALGFTWWLGTGLGLFVFGWIVQFIGHHYEGKKPAFVDDIVGLLIGPLFVLAEVLFMFGLCKPLQAKITQRAGPVKRF